MPKEKFMDRLRTYGMSIKVPLTGLVIAVAILPLFLQAAVMLGSFNQGQLDARTIEIQNQCVILSNKMTRSGYMTAEKKNATGLDSQMQAIADVYNGRIVIVNTNFRVVTDTFNLATGKYYISEEVIKCFKGENSSHYNKDMQYLAQTIPVYDPANEKNINGVIVVTASTENILSLTDKAMGKSNLFLVCMCLVLAVLAAVAVHIIMRPFKNLQMSFDRVAQGDLDADISEDTYRETRQLSHSVQKSLSKLKAVDQSRQEFVSNVSHELKTPLTSMKVLADSLLTQEDVPAELYKEFMGDLSEEIERENKIINDLLSLVKMDKTANTLNIKSENMNTLVEKILKRLRPIAATRNIEVVFESFRPVTAEVDEMKLSLAISNLVENAIKYNKDDGWIHVSLNADHKYCYIEVADSGIGIPEESAEHIFERFYRVDKSHSREIGGTGLGLAIARSAVLMHRGAIKVYSQLGEGTTFTIRIPLTYVS